MRFVMQFQGRVQGVGFRAFVQAKANEFSLRGWVRNLSNGDVLCEVQGGEEDIRQFRVEVEQGNGISRVDNLTEQEIPEVFESGRFRVLY